MLLCLLSFNIQTVFAQDNNSSEEDTELTDSSDVAAVDSTSTDEEEAPVVAEDNVEGMRHVYSSSA